MHSPELSPSARVTSAVTRSPRYPSPGFRPGYSSYSWDMYRSPPFSNQVRVPGTPPQYWQAMAYLSISRSHPGHFFIGFLSINALKGHHTKFNELGIVSPYFSSTPWDIRARIVYINPRGTSGNLINTPADINHDKH